MGNAMASDVLRHFEHIRYCTLTVRPKKTPGINVLCYFIFFDM